MTATPRRRSTTRLKKLALWGLAAANGGLALALAGRAIGAGGGSSAPIPILGESTALAQRAGAQMGNRRPGEYVIIPGAVQGSSSEVVYIFDMANGELSAAALNNTSGKLDFLPKINLGDTFRAAERATTPPAGGTRR